MARPFPRQLRPENAALAELRVAGNMRLVWVTDIMAGITAVGLEQLLADLNTWNHFGGARDIIRGNSCKAAGLTAAVVLAGLGRDKCDKSVYIRLPGTVGDVAMPLETLGNVFVIKGRAFSSHRCRLER